VIGHSGTLTLGAWAGTRVLVYGGRLHFYEGHAWEAVVKPIELAASLGVSMLFLTNAAGGIHGGCDQGGFMAITDHIEWTRPYCWRLPGPGGVGPTRPSPYSWRLVNLLTTAATELGINIHRGVYAALTGPSYETPAEIRALRAWGADAVGMSTAREIERGYDLGLECGALSLITNKAAGLSAAPLDHKDVLITAKAQEDSLARLLEAFVRFI
jgi:purine-nucleoside phosphorylase